LQLGWDPPSTTSHVDHRGDLFIMDPSSLRGRHSDHTADSPNVRRLPWRRPPGVNAGPTTPGSSVTRTEADSTGAVRCCPHPLTSTRQPPWPSYSTWLPRRFNCAPNCFKLEIPPGEEFLRTSAISRSKSLTPIHRRRVRAWFAHACQHAALPTAKPQPECAVLPDRTWQPTTPLSQDATPCVADLRVVADGLSRSKAQSQPRGGVSPPAPVDMAPYRRGFAAKRRGFLGVS